MRPGVGSIVLTLSLTQLVMFAAGLVVGGLSSWYFLRVRAGGRRLRFEGEPPEGRGGVLSFPTQVCIGLVGILIAYHLIVWAFPPSLTAVQLTRTRWWVWGLLGMGACGLSVLLDRVDRER